MVDIRVVVSCDECGVELHSTSYEPPVHFICDESQMEGYDIQCDDCIKKGAREARLERNQKLREIGEYERP